MKWKRYIIHSDLNHCYAQIEEMQNPRLRSIPMAVGGDEKKRHGIILAKNDKAKAYKIKTGESLREAYEKCPNLYIIKPTYGKYIYYTDKVKEIYARYTDKIESFGLDEAWLDISDCQRLYKPLDLARHIQNEIYEELGLKVSMGISFNKIFAKLGSDMDKDRGFVIISPDNYKDLIYPLKVEELLYVGQATKVKLNSYNIYTIGDLANSNPEYLNLILGKNGVMLQRFARGLEDDPVKMQDYTREVKSVSNGITTIRDLKSFNDLKMVFWVLAEAVASRLRGIDKKARVIAIGLRDTNLRYCTRQMTLDEPTDLADEILASALTLSLENCPFDDRGRLLRAYRSITIRATKLEKLSYIEYDLFNKEDKREKERSLEETLDYIKERFGADKISRLILKMDEDLTNFNPKDDHVIHPESWF